MRILLCNDDGYNAPGIRVLAEVLRRHGHTVLTVAPNEEQSGKSHSITFHRPLLVRRLQDELYAVHGTPADCVSIALYDICKQEPPDLVISGINAGLNVGIDINYSGTVGAATEATLLGFRAIAVSVDVDFSKPIDQQRANFERAAKLTADLIEQYDSIRWPQGEVLNLNVPSHIPKGVVAAASTGLKLHAPTLHKLIDKAEALTDRVAVYIFAGDKLTEFDPVNADEDVALVMNGYATISFLQGRQGATESTRGLTQLANILND